MLDCNDVEGAFMKLLSAILTDNAINAPRRFSELVKLLIAIDDISYEQKEKIVLKMIDMIVASNTSVSFTEIALKLRSNFIKP